MSEQCPIPTKSGAACKGRVWRDGLCRFHHPDAEPERAEARRKGGENKANAVRAERRMVVAKTRDVHVILGTALYSVFKGDLDPGTASALATLGRATLLAIEKDKLEHRVAELERRAGIVTDEGMG